ncbi:pyruvate dehydrogenase (acetyl-transferring) E1 component subunit alpha [Rubrivirga sp. IMCC45206]|uniref:pyruvate dehydrogenase (acetyl-transferring) E1 component subunit alpha n=1 Tax=Rubrivirga sp. IMCC45206 TaxID=3391614 RepID=UPI00398FECDE
MAGTTAKKKAPAKKAPARKAAAKTAAGNGASDFTPAVPDVRIYRDSGHTHESLGLSADDVLAMYENMLLQRRFEERAAQMYGRQKIAGFLHLYIGQEAVSTGAVWGTRPDDPIITAYRDHGLALARGMSSESGMAELFGKIDGCSRGKGGSMHFFDVEKHFYGGHGIVGGQIPVGVGMGFACKYKETGGVAMAFFGDGAINQGAFHEATNLAALYDVPVLIIVENNAYAMGTSIERSRGDAELYKQAYPYGMPAAVIDGMDLFEVYGAFKEIADDARGATDGQTKPYFVEVQTYRYRGHSMSDPQKYRTKEEMESKKNEDPIIRTKTYLLDNDLATEEQLDAIDETVKAEVMEAVEFAENSPLPGIETMYEDVYSEDGVPIVE